MKYCNQCDGLNPDCAGYTSPDFHEFETLMVKRGVCENFEPRMEILKGYSIISANGSDRYDGVPDALEEDPLPLEAADLDPVMAMLIHYPIFSEEDQL